MKKLFKLKNWLTVEETSQRLSTVFEEHVSVADCLQLAIDGHIVISALLPKPRFGRKAKVLNSMHRSILRSECNSKYEENVHSYYHEVTTSGNIIEVDDGVWDLPMIGSERFDIEHALALEQNREPNIPDGIGDAYLNRGNYIIHSMKMFDNIELESKGGGLVEIYDQDIKQQVPFEGTDQFFYPTHGLEDGIIVFRRENIELFEKNKLNDGSETISLSESLDVIGTMLDAIKNTENKARRWTQESLKTEMEERNPLLKKRRIDEYFSLANKHYKSR